MSSGTSGGIPQRKEDSIMMAMACQSGPDVTTSCPDPPTGNPDGVGEPILNKLPKSFLTDSEGYDRTEVWGQKAPEKKSCPLTGPRHTDWLEETSLPLHFQNFSTWVGKTKD